MSRVSGKPYFVYALRSQQAHRFYIGVSENPQQRLLQHNTATSGWTTRYCPWRLVHQERYEDYRAARQRERLLKRQKGGQGFFKLTGLDPGKFLTQPAS